MTLRYLAIAPLLLVSMGAQADEATSIKDKVPREMLAQYCQSRGVGSENEVQLALPDGSVISGTIHCEAADLIVGDAAGQGADAPAAGDVPAATDPVTPKPGSAI